MVEVSERLKLRVTAGPFLLLFLFGKLPLFFGRYKATYKKYIAPRNRGTTKLVLCFEKHNFRFLLLPIWRTRSIIWLCHFGLCSNRSYCIVCPNDGVSDLIRILRLLYLFI